MFLYGISGPSSTRTMVGMFFYYVDISRECIIYSYFFIQWFVTYGYGIIIDDLDIGSSCDYIDCLIFCC